LKREKISKILKGFFGESVKVPGLDFQIKWFPNNVTTLDNGSIPQVEPDRILEEEFSTSSQVDSVYSIEDVTTYDLSD
jgi:hypothetical protein